MSKLLKITAPFLALAITFVSLGILLDDRRQLYFGLVWLVIAAGAALWRQTRTRNR